MVNFVLAIGMIIIVIGCAIVAIWWVAREHLVARKYRYLIRLYHQLPKSELQPRTPINKGKCWEVTYKDKKTIHTIQVEAENEGAAIRQLLQLGIDYKTVVKFLKL